MSRPTLRLCLAQLNLRVGAIADNTARIIAVCKQARDVHAADVVIFPELAITGYPPEDLLLRPGLHERVAQALQNIRQAIQGIDVILGYPQSWKGQLYNACSVIHQGTLAATYHKQQLPNYSVFDEKRYFRAGHAPCVVDLQGIRTGLSICEDIWVPGLTRQAVAAGARLLVNINASPYHIGKPAERERVLRARLSEAAVPVVYLNQIGGQDELVFDGGSMVMDSNGSVVFRGRDFEEGLYLVELDQRGHAVIPRAGEYNAPPEGPESVYRALVLGIRDYVINNGFNGVVIGLSGGIDSAVTLALACDALGPESVEAVLMPSRYTASMSIEDAREEAETLGVAHHIVPIEEMVDAFGRALAPVFEGTRPDTTEENVQARTRGILLMAVSNKKRKMVLTTGNKSEMAVGYATLYGDMAGGFAPLKDVTKAMVYRLARWRNGVSPVIPQRVLERPPSAELAPDQKDEDTLPPYSVLDQIVERYIEHDQTPQEIIAAGFAPEAVRKVVVMVDLNEYKRRQAAPGVRITKRAFGRDRRYPITSAYSELED